MKPEDVAYIAGLLDGEGCFLIEKFAVKTNIIGYQYRPKVEVTMCQERPIVHVASLTGRQVQFRSIKSGRIAYKCVWRNRYAADLLRLVIPFLKGKREEAEIILDYFDNHSPGRGKEFLPEHGIKAEEARQRLYDLKFPHLLRC